MKLSFLKQAQVSLMAFLFIVFLASCKKEEITQTPESSKNPSSSARTIGLNGNGVNIQPSYYNGGNIDIGWAQMKTLDANAKIKVVRIEIEPGKETQAAQWIKDAYNNGNGFQVIATYHNYLTIGQTNGELGRAATWWINNYNTLTSGRTVPIIINIINEWGAHGISDKIYADNYYSAIARIRRDIGYSGPIIVDLPGYGQDARIAAKAINLYKTSDPAKYTTLTKDIIYSAHIYQNAYDEGYGWFDQSSIDVLHNTGVRCMLGEFGVRYRTDKVYNIDGTLKSETLKKEGNTYVYRINLTRGTYAPDNFSSDTEAINYVSNLVTYAKGKGWSVLGWAWNGDGLGMNMTYPDWAFSDGINLQYPAMADTKITNWSAINYIKTDYSGTGVWRSKYFKTIYDLL